MLFCRHYFSPLYTFIRKEKDLEPDQDPYLWLMNPGGPKTCGSCGSGSGSGSPTLLFCLLMEGSGSQKHNCTKYVIMTVVVDVCGRCAVIAAIRTRSGPPSTLASRSASSAAAFTGRLSPLDNIDLYWLVSDKQQSCTIASLPFVRNAWSRRQLDLRLRFW